MTKAMEAHHVFVAVDELEHGVAALDHAQDFVADALDVLEQHLRGALVEVVDVVVELVTGDGDAVFVRRMRSTRTRPGPPGSGRGRASPERVPSTSARVPTPWRSVLAGQQHHRHDRHGRDEERGRQPVGP